MVRIGAYIKKIGYGRRAVSSVANAPTHLTNIFNVSSAWLVAVCVFAIVALVPDLADAALGANKKVFEDIKAAGASVQEGVATWIPVAGMISAGVITIIMVFTGKLQNRMMIGLVGGLFFFSIITGIMAFLGVS